MTGITRKEDWEQFRAMGRAPEGLRDVVLASWQRAVRQDDLASRTRAPLVSGDAFAGLHQANRDVLGAARDHLARNVALMRASRAIMVLCDPQGVVLEADGCPAVIDHARDDRLLLGGRWDEAAIGTNAIGTAIHTGQPVEIRGAEHFCEGIQKWNCAATPLRHPVTGALIGVLDITGPSEFVQPHAAALSLAVAGQIMQTLAQDLAIERAWLLETLLARRIAGDFILFDRFGQRISGVDLADRSGLPGLIRAMAQRPDAPDLRALAEAVPGAEADILRRGDAALGVVLRLLHPTARRQGAERPAIAGRGDELDALAAASARLAPLCAQARMLLEARVPLLLQGETGTGKETLARALANTVVPEGPVSLVECSGLAEHAAGDWPVAGGTLILIEPAETPPEAQPLLLRHLKALAGDGAAPVRLIALSTPDLAAARDAGQLRCDLFYRLAGAVLRLPPLRDRRAEILPLLRRFAGQAVEGSRRSPLRFTPAAQRVLEAYDWPGNLHELRNLVLSLSALSSSRLIDLPDLPPEMTQPRPPLRESALRDRARADILQMIDETGGNLAEAARRLGIARSTLYLKLDSYGIRRR